MIAVLMAILHSDEVTGPSTRSRDHTTALHAVRLPLVGKLLVRVRTRSTPAVDQTTVGLLRCGLAGRVTVPRAPSLAPGPNSVRGFFVPMRARGRSKHDCVTCGEYGLRLACGAGWTEFAARGASVCSETSMRGLGIAGETLVA